MKNECSFEDTMELLEEKVSNLEKGNLSLEEAIANFEEGIKLSKIANKKLDEAEKKINILLESEDGELREEQFKEED